MKADRDILLMVGQCLLCALLLATLLLIRPAHSQQRTVYGADGRVTARIATDTQGTTTVYNARGNVVARETSPDLRKPHVCPVKAPCLPIGIGPRW